MELSEIKKNNEDNKNLYSLLIPTFNERENIAILVYMIKKYLGRS